MNRLHIGPYVLLLIVCVSSDEQYGSFWQVTDFHFDSNYSTQGKATKKCHKISGQEGKLGPFGDYACDSPLKLVKSAIDAMYQIKQNPDFILWTGDSVPHVLDTDINSDKVYGLIRNITTLLQAKFPKRAIFPAVGNHDIWPSNQVPVKKDAAYYENMLTSAKWNPLLTEDQIKTFKIGGYYSVDMPPFLILVLNTVLYYKQDHLTKNISDPGGQFQWMEKELRKVQGSGKKVMFVGHVPPGGLAGDLKYHFAWFYQNFNKRFLKISRDYSSVTAAHVYGHEHTDGFHVLYQEDGKNIQPSVSMFMGPAVTPWKNVVTSNNPSVRLYNYSKTTGKILDYKQYYLDLKKANQGQGKWELEYQATKAYDIKDVSATSLHKLAKEFMEGKYFDKYWKYASVSYSDKKCEGECKKQVLCAITMLDLDKYEKCYKNKDLKGALEEIFTVTTNFIGHHLVGESHGVYMVMIAFMVVVIIMFVVLMILFRRGRGRNSQSLSSVRYSKLAQGL